MALQWSTTAQDAQDNGIKVLVHGRSGAGKTCLIPTAPRPIIASAERGTLSIASANIPLARIACLKDLQEFFDWCRASAEAKNFDTVCLDSLSEIGERLLSDEKRSAKDPRQAYGEMQDQIAVLVRQFRDLHGKHVYFSAKTELRDQPDGTKMWGPSMPGNKLSQGLPYFFDECFYLGVGEIPSNVAGQPSTKYRFIQTGSDTQHEAKDRSGALDMLEPPNLTHIFDKIRRGVLTKPPTA